MDEKLRALLRRYAATGSDADAHAAAHAAYHSKDQIDLKIWVMHTRIRDKNGIELFLTQWSALQRAIEWIEEWLREYQGHALVDEQQVLDCEAELSDLRMLLIESVIDTSIGSFDADQSKRALEILGRADSYLPAWASVYLTLNSVED